ncbi:TetR/AcrR family transcriptional regulator [Nocardiopsis protaetiae]|uniref:TetR/AcrR family transcriptional regulator n=1 Tax=Nocardiopsis protaetiae TaxID=3382270 RepID=UPI00387ADA43
MSQLDQGAAPSARAADGTGPGRLQADDLPGSERYGEVPRRLLLSAAACFAANGFHGTTTRHIAAGAGLSPAALYVHFPSKELALYEVVRLGHEHARSILTGPDVEALADPGERLAEIVSRYTRFHARHHVVARVCQYDLGALAPEHYAEVLRIRQATNEVFRVAVASGVDSGAFRADVDVRRVSRALISLAIDLVRWYRPEGPESPEQLGEFNAGLALRLVTA